jgi:hypothetical protein
MAGQIFSRLKLEKKELEWLYVPDVVYHEYENCKRNLQLIIPFKRCWKEHKVSFNTFCTGICVA